MKKLGQDPAFACSAQLDGGEAIYEPGMSKRFYAACAAMQGILASGRVRTDDSDVFVTRKAYIIADKLLKLENDGS